MNARSCATCPAARNKDKDGEETVADFLELFESLLPEGGVAPLFEGADCALCKGEHKGKRTSYAIVDFGHREPKALHFRRAFKKSGVGFLLPLQFNCCTACRRRILLLTYLPLLALLALGAPVAILLSIPHVGQGLRAASPWLPLLLAVVAAGGGYAIGVGIKHILAKRFSTGMYVDLLTHPVAKAMLEKGWFPLFGEKKPQPVFAKKRIRYGLGNAPSEAYARKIPENGENQD